MLSLSSCESSGGSDISQSATLAGKPLDQLCGWVVREHGGSIPLAVMRHWLKDAADVSDGSHEQTHRSGRHSDLGVPLRSIRPNRLSLPRYGSRVGLRIVLFEMLWGDPAMIQARFARSCPTCPTRDKWDKTRSCWLTAGLTGIFARVGQMGQNATCPGREELQHYLRGTVDAKSTELNEKRRELKDCFPVIPDSR
jgi:hypothetical protein